MPTIVVPLADIITDEATSIDLTVLPKAPPSPPSKTSAHGKDSGIHQDFGVRKHDIACVDHALDERIIGVRSGLLFRAILYSA